MQWYYTAQEVRQRAGGDLSSLCADIINSLGRNELVLSPHATHVLADYVCGKWKRHDITLERCGTQTSKDTAMYIRPNLTVVPEYGTSRVILVKVCAAVTRVNQTQTLLLGMP